jgi:FixJ family two-component response regulator
VETRGVIAIVDDEEPIRVGLASLMRSVDLVAETYPSADAFLECDFSRYFCVLSDIQMPGASGLDLLKAVRGQRPALPVILMTAFPDERSRAQAAAHGCHRFLTKPGDPDEIIDLIDRLLEEQ